MSLDILYFVPKDPLLTLGEKELGEALAYAREAFPMAPGSPYEVTSFAWEVPQFLDAGENFESVRCPSCRHDVLEWWKDAMGRWWDGDRRDLRAALPCCGIDADLDALEYDWPQGFACCGIRIENPERMSRPSDREVLETSPEHRCA